MGDNYHDCTLLLCSCDAYEDTWVPFFTLLQRQWPQFDLPIVLNTEHKVFTFPGFDICTINQRYTKSIPWGQRMVDCLANIDTEYVLLMLDDFFLCESVDDTRFRQTLEWMRTDPKIASFCFHIIKDKNNVPDSRFPGFVKRPLRGEYRFNCQAGLWNTKQLANSIRPNENPWVWETLGNRRSFKSDMDYYCADDAYPPVFDYRFGSGIIRGRWYLPYVQPLFKKYDITIDFSKRGDIGDDELDRKAQQKNHVLTYRLRRLYGNVVTVIKNLQSLK